MYILYAPYVMDLDVASSCTPKRLAEDVTSLYHLYIYSVYGILYEYIMDTVVVFCTCRS